MRFGWNAKDAFNRTLGTAYVVSVLVLLIYTFVYWFEPFSSAWNDFFSNFFPVLTSLAAALIATLIWNMYDKTDAPRRVWAPFMIGLWLWVAAETSWGVINMTQGQVRVGWPDVFWISAYAILGHTLSAQYMILFRPTLKKLISRMAIAVAMILVVTWLVYILITTVTGMPHNWDAVVSSFYPVADLMLALIALKLARNFSGGAFARPWLGLIVFAVADLIYAWLEISGMYTWSVNQGNLFSAVADISYVAAYLVMSLGLLYQWLFLKYGMRPHQEVR